MSCEGDKEEQAFWDAVFLLSMSEKIDRGLDAVRATERSRHVR